MAPASPNPLELAQGHLVSIALPLNDYWVLGERETWNKAHKPGDTLRASAPGKSKSRVAIGKGHQSCI